MRGRQGSVPEFLQVISQNAYSKKGVRFLWETHIDFSTYGDIIRKMTALGNIQFRHVEIPKNYYYCCRDAREILLGKLEINPKECLI